MLRTTPRSRLPTTLLAAAFVVLTIGCWWPGSGEHTETILPWLTCGDCLGGELDSVLALGEEAVPELVSALDGPPPEVIDALRTRANRHWERTARYLVSRGERVPFDRATFLSREESRFDTTYRMRAIDALVAIGGDRARTGLTRARRASDRDPSLQPRLRVELSRAIARVTS